MYIYVYCDSHVVLYYGTTSSCDRIWSFWLFGCTDRSMSALTFTAEAEVDSRSSRPLDFTFFAFLLRVFFFVGGANWPKGLNVSFSGFLFQRLGWGYVCSNELMSYFWTAWGVMITECRWFHLKTCFFWVSVSHVISIVCWAILPLGWFVLFA